LVKFSSVVSEICEQTDAFITILTPLWEEGKIKLQKNVKAHLSDLTFVKK